MKGADKLSPATAEVRSRQAGVPAPRGCGMVELNSEECKGCGLCVEACPPKVLLLADHLNRYGYHPATYAGVGCTGCGICFFVCPEPGAIMVLRAAA
jgi:2-oxoglutarate ferredoxin oxidoreductase subunit delta